MSDDLKAMFEAVGRQFSDSQAETRRLFETTAESLRGEIRAVAERVIQTREDLIRETTGVRDEVRRTADETQAMIRFPTFLSLVEGGVPPFKGSSDQERGGAPRPQRCGNRDRS